MLSINQIKYLKSFQSKKQRQNYNIFVAEGDKIATELLSSTKYSVQAIYALNNWIMQNSNLLKNCDQIFEITERELKGISLLKTPNQVFLVVKKLDEEVNYSLISASNIIYLDGVQDPGNVGTILRIADWFGFSTVIRSAKTADFYNPKVIQASMGSFLRINLFSSVSFQQLKEKLKHKVYVADMEGENVYDTNFETPSLLVFGNEGAGVSDEFINREYKIVSIQARNKKEKADSLNVAVSAGIIASIFQQKQKP